MNRTTLCLLGAATLLTASACGSPPRTEVARPEPPRLAYPAARRVETTDVLHGIAVADPYRWLETSSAEVLAWTKAEADLTRGVLDKLPGRDAFVTRLRQLFYVERVSLPERRGDRYFFTRRSATEEKSVLVVRDGAGGRERVLLDPNKWPEADALSLLGQWISWDGKKVAYAVSKNHADMATLYVMDVASGVRSEVDVIDRVRSSDPSWSAAGDGFYYNRLPKDKAIPESELAAYDEVRYHRLGDDPSNDRLVREKTGDASIYQAASLSRDGHWLVLTVSRGWAHDEVYFRDMRSEVERGWVTLAAGRDVKQSVHAYKDAFYVQTDDGAPKGRIFRVDPAKPERAAWTEIVPARDDATLEAFSIIGDHLVVRWLKDATSRVDVRALDGRLVRELALPTLGTVEGISGNEDEDEALYRFTSYVAPPEIRALSIRAGGERTWHRASPPVDLTPYAVDQVFFLSKDGTRVPMFIVQRKNQRRDGSAPTILSGYGGFQVSITPFYQAGLPAWLERGGVYVEANLRGGAEYGKEWHRGGSLTRKQNVFDDFVGAAEELVRLGITRPDRLAIEGASNGGLLVGAALTQRPDLFRVALCGVPLLDMVRYPLFGQGKAWVPEYGSPESATDFKALLAYSPYHHVKPGTRYPSVLILSADSDDRVDPMHARKFAAAMQAATTGGPVLLRIETHAGHGGADLVRAWVDEKADQYAFTLNQMGL